jgi:hypothetical protein
MIYTGNAFRSGGAAPFSAAFPART